MELTGKPDAWKMRSIVLEITRTSRSEHCGVHSINTPVPIVTRLTNLEGVSRRLASSEGRTKSRSASRTFGVGAEHDCAEFSHRRWSKIVVVGLTAIFGAMMAGAGAAMNTQAVDVPEIVRAASPSVVTLHVRNEAGDPIGLGSAFFIEPAVLVTNLHVIRGAASVDARRQDGHILPVLGVLGVNDEADIALLQVSPEFASAGFLQLSTQLPEVGSRVLVIGAPKGLDHSVSDGLVAALRDEGSGGRLIQMTAPISPGSSGSPVLDVRGKVIGVATLQFREGQNLNFAVPISEVEKVTRSAPVPLIQWSTIAPTASRGAIRSRGFPVCRLSAPQRDP
jgi:S1-C subfamily serine protease